MNDPSGIMQLGDALDVYPENIKITTYARQRPEEVPQFVPEYP